MIKPPTCVSAYDDLPTIYGRNKIVWAAPVEPLQETVTVFFIANPDTGMDDYFTHVDENDTGSPLIYAGSKPPTSRQDYIFPVI